MTEQPATPTLDELTEQLETRLNNGLGDVFALDVEERIRSLYPDYADRAISDAHTRHDQGIEIARARGELSAALIMLDEGVRFARAALAKATTVYDVELHPEEGGRLLPVALDQIETQLAAIRHLTRHALPDQP